MTPSLPPTHSTTQQPVPHSSAIPTGSTLAQVSIALTAILLLVVTCGWLAKRSGLMQRKTGSDTLNISASCQLGQRERLLVVEVEDARLVLGVTAQQITHIHTLPPRASAENPTPTVAQTNFRQALQTLLQRSGKS